MNQTSVALAALFCCFGVAHAGPIADRMTRPIQEQENAQRALDLDRQQRVYREQTQELSTSERMELERRLRQQQVRQRTLQQRQLQQADTARRLQSAVPGHRSEGGHAARAQRDRTEQQSQMLHFKIQQSTWPYRTPPPAATRPPSTGGALDRRMR